MKLGEEEKVIQKRSALYLARPPKFIPVLRESGFPVPTSQPKAEASMCAKGVGVGI